MKAPSLSGSSSALIFGSGSGSISIASPGMVGKSWRGGSQVSSRSNGFVSRAARFGTITGFGWS
jgi:hypothetical protein